MAFSLNPATKKLLKAAGVPEDIVGRQFVYRGMDGLTAAGTITGFVVPDPKTLLLHTSLAAGNRPPILRYSQHTSKWTLDLSHTFRAGDCTADGERRILELSGTGTLTILGR